MTNSQNEELGSGKAEHNSQRSASHAGLLTIRPYPAIVRVTVIRAR